ncbi:MAG: peptidase sortase [Parcubacteria group bacterium]|nr:peptidase sortase [Parcubacteria group bacterium]
MKKKQGARFALILFVIFGLSTAFAAPFAANAHAQVTISPGDYPVRITAPSVKLDSPIQPVGVNTKGEMSVPSGSTKNVGWYKYGTVPGTTGTAVLDAHVFAAFKTLANVKIGGDIYVYMHSGKKLHFVVTKAKTYALSTLSSSTLFAATNSKQLNLITCAGKLTADHSTYDHRLIVSAQLV